MYKANCGGNSKFVVQDAPKKDIPGTRAAVKAVAEALEMVSQIVGDLLERI